MKKRKTEVDMTVVSKESMLQYLAWRREYTEKKEAGVVDKELFNKIENFIVNVINKDKEYYTKLSSYSFSSEDLRYCM